MDWETLSSLLDPRLFAVVRAILLITVGLLGARLGAMLVARSVQSTNVGRFAPLVRRATFWSLAFIVVTSALSELGFDLSVLIGAAGILTVAVGFASQTSASNVVSGLFLLAEQPFAEGDSIKVGQTTGVVLSIDLLSVKLRTFDNLFVRVPNETVMKSEITNLSRFPVRRADLPIRVPYGTDLDHVRNVLIKTADADPLVLDEPRPVVLFQGYGDNGVELQFSAWAVRERFLEMKGSLWSVTQGALAAEGIEVAVPHRKLVGPMVMPRPAA